MNWLGLVLAAIAALAIITALVFLYLHRDGSGPKPPDSPKLPPNMNGRAQERRDGRDREKPGEPFRRRRVVPGSWEAKK